MTILSPSLPVSPPRVAVVLNDELVRRHQRGVWRFLRFLGAAPALADDLTQEAFLTVLRKPPLDQGDRALAAWLRTTARRLYLMHGRCVRAELRAAAAEELDELFVEHAHSDDAESYMAALDECLSALPPRQRECLEARYASGAERQAIGDQLGLSVEGVKTLLRRARVDLRSCIENKLRERP